MIALCHPGVPCTAEVIGSADRPEGAGSAAHPEAAQSGSVSVPCPRPLMESLPLPPPGAKVVAHAPPSIEALVDLTYAELHMMACRLMRSQSRAQTLQATSLLHEAFVRLASRADGWNDKEHFVRSIACAMRNILVDHARARAVRGTRRGDDKDLDALVDDCEVVTGDLVRLNEALDALGLLDPDAVRIIELRYIASLSVAECAAAMGLSKRQAERDLQFARGWLRLRLT